MPLVPVDVRIEKHTDKARKKIVSVPVYRLKFVENSNKKALSPVLPSSDLKIIK